MNFVVSQESLADALAIVSKGVASASTLPILSGVRIKAPHAGRGGGPAGHATNYHELHESRLSSRASRLSFYIVCPVADGNYRTASRASQAAARIK